MDVWIQILLISLGISIFSQFLNKVMKMDSAHMKETQTRMRALSQELDASRGASMGNVQVGQPTRSYDEINQELMALMKKMSKEQLLPMCLRCGIFWGIYALLGAIYGNPPDQHVLSFDFLFFGHEWIGAYVLFSLIFSFSFLGLQKLYKKLTHQNQPVAPAIAGMELPRVTWKDRLESAKKDSQGEDRPENPPSP